MKQQLWEYWKTTTGVLCIAIMMVGCMDKPDNVVWNIEQYGTTCRYWAPHKIRVDAPCGLYKIGDTLISTK